MKITINGAVFDVVSPSATYEQIIDLAGEKPCASVVYASGMARRGDHRRVGILMPGNSVELEEGMTFTAIMTGNA